MSLPFDQAQFFAVFRQYNEAVWPFQLVLLLLGLAALALAGSKASAAGRVISIVLAMLWAWMGAVYHLVFFLPINPAAGAFGALFLAGAALFLWEGVVRGRLQFHGLRDWRGAFALGLAAYALVAYPLLGLASGRNLPELASFGLPCPTTIFTIAMLGLATVPFPRTVLVVPLLWSLVGAQAAWRLGVYEDSGLIVAAAAGIWFALTPGFHRRLA